MSPVRTTPGATLRPPRWQPAMLRWHRTNVSWVQSWWLAIGTLPRWRDRTIIDYLATQLPGQDDVLVARLPFLRFVVVRSPEIARHVLVSNQDNYIKSADYDMLAVAFGRGLVTEIFLGASPGLQVRGKLIPFVAGRSPALEVGVLGRRCIA